MSDRVTATGAQERSLLGNISSLTRKKGYGTWQPGNAQGSVQTVPVVPSQPGTL